MNVDFHNKIFFESYNMQKAMQLFEFIFAFSFHIDTFIIYLFLIFFHTCLMLSTYLILVVQKLCTLSRLNFKGKTSICECILLIENSFPISISIRFVP